MTDTRAAAPTEGAPELDARARAARRIEAAGKAQAILTPARARVLEAIIAHVRENGWPPTMRELCTRLDVSSTRGVEEHLDRLERDGLLEREHGRPRAMRVTARGDEELAKLRR